MKKKILEIKTNVSFEIPVRMWGGGSGYDLWGSEKFSYIYSSSPLSTIELTKDCAITVSQSIRVSLLKLKDSKFDFKWSDERQAQQLCSVPRPFSRKLKTSNTYNILKCCLPITQFNGFYCIISLTTFYDKI